MSRAGRRHPDWCCIDLSPKRGPALHCQRCGARHPLQFPVPLVRLAALGIAFERLHTECAEAPGAAAGVAQAEAPEVLA